MQNKELSSNSRHFQALTGFLTSPFPILELPNPWIDNLYKAQARRTADFNAPKLW